VPGHLVGVGAFRGIAIFDAENPSTPAEIAVHRYDGWFELRDGNGPFHGHALWTFKDGSTLRAAYEGRAENASDTGVDVSAEFHDFQGTGRFAGVDGEGSFKGRRLVPIEAGGGTYLRGALRLTLPD